jgi:hemolysin activation/secretion protein
MGHNRTKNFLGVVSVISISLIMAQSRVVASNSNPIWIAQTPPPQDIFPDRDPPSSPPVTPSPQPSPPQELIPPSDLRVPLPMGNETFTITEFIFTGNTRFSDETLAEKFTNDLRQQSLSISQLVTIATEIAQFYQEQGYATTGAIVNIPRKTQNQGTGKAEIQIIEGEVEQITVVPVNETRLPNRYIHSRLAIATEKPLHLPSLREALQLLQLDPRIASLSASLSEGTQQGKSILEVSYRPAVPFQGGLNVDNGRVPSVGSFQGGISLDHHNLLGFSDRATLNYANSEGSNIIDVTYAIPINARNGTLTFGFGHNDSNVIEPPFDEIDIATDSQTYELSLRQPLVRTIEEQVFQEFALGLTASLRDSQATVLDEPFPLSRGAEEDGETRIFALRFFQDYTRSSARNVFALRSQFNFGIDALDATTNEQLPGVERIPDSEFFSWQGQAQYVRLLGEDQLFLLRGSAQLADQTLLAAEQYSLGGINTVRGYRQDQLLSDNGVFLSAEVQLPILRAFNRQGVLQIAPFFDWGTSWNSSGLSNPDPSTLSSVGIGLQWRYADTFTARLDWGIPLVEVEDRDRTLQEDGLVFSIQVNPF